MLKPMLLGLHLASHLLNYNIKQYPKDVMFEILEFEIISLPFNASETPLVSYFSILVITPKKVELVAPHIKPLVAKYA